MAISVVEYHSIQEVYSLPPQQAMISVVEPRAKKWPAFFGWPHVLRLVFDDVEWEHRERLIAFSESDAIQIIEFLDSLPDDVNRIDVHCHAGVSRSAAIARFISQKYSLPFDEEQGRCFNRRVYRMLVDKAGLPYQESEVILRQLSEDDIF